MRIARYHGTCVNWNQHDLQSLHDMIDSAITISRQTFRKHVDHDDLRLVERQLGYDEHPKQGLTMAGDNYVSYHRSTLKGQRVYYFRQSAIEHVFA